MLSTRRCDSQPGSYNGDQIRLVFPAALILVGEETVHAIESAPVFTISTICLPLPLILIGLYCTYQGVVNAMRALSDKPIRYALSIPFVK
jgi:hypothetical protein